MESKANYALVGLISLLVFILAAGFIYWFAISDTKTVTREYRIIFGGTVTGLSSGTQVLFNGIKVGQVKTLRIDPENPSRVLARIEIAESAPVKTDTRAVLESQGLTGVSFVQLSGGTPDAPPLAAKAGEDLPTIIADKSDLQTIMDGVRSTIENASTAFDKLDHFFDDNEEKTTAILSNVEQFSSALAANADDMQTFLASISEAGGQVGPLASDLRELSGRLNALVGNVKPGQVADIVDNVDSFSSALAGNSGKLDRFFADATRLSASLNRSADTISEVAAALDPKTISGIVDNVSRVSSTVAGNTENFNALMASSTSATAKANTLLGEVAPGRIAQTVDDLSAFSSMLAANTDKVNAVVADAINLSGSLTNSAQTLSTLVAAVDPETVSTVVNNVSNASKALAGSISSYNATIANARDAATRLNALVGEVEPGTIGKTVDDLSAFSSTLASNRSGVDAIVADTGKLTGSLNRSAEKIAALADRVNAIVASVDPAKVGKMVDDLSSVSTTIGDNRDNVDKFMTDMTSVSSRLAASVDKVQKIVDNLDSMTSDADTAGLFQQLSDAAEAVRVLAQNLDTRTATITTGIGRFSTEGLAQYQGLATDARQVLRRLDKVLSNIDRNPQSIIFGNGGSGGVREYTKQ